MAGKATKFWRFDNSADDGSAELYLYGTISEYSWWEDDVTPKQFNDDLAALGDVSTIKVRINSPGGDVFAAAAIHNALKNHKATVTAYVDGLAASAASVVAMAGDVVVMPRTAMMMIHNPATIAWGDARDMRATADVLDKVRDTIIAAYESKTGKSRQELINLMNSETWMTADDALSMGFADEIDEQTPVTACVRGQLMIVNGMGFELSKFKTIPAAILAGGKEVNNKVSKPTPTPIDTAEEPEVQTPAAGEEPEEPAAVDQGAAAEPAADPTGEPEAGADDVIAQERQRIKNIMALKRPGAESIINDAIDQGLSAEATALRILQSDDVKRAEALVRRRADAPNVEPGSEEPTAQEQKVGVLTNALKKARGIKD